LLPSKEVSHRARKSLAKAKKIPAKFDVYRSRTSLLLRKRDVNSSLQIKTRSMLDSAAFDPDLQGRDRVAQRALRIRFGFQLPSIRRILPSLAEDHVKHRFEHVKLCVELPCVRAITLRFV
jgi:hypothetical protein